MTETSDRPAVHYTVYEVGVGSEGNHLRVLPCSVDTRFPFFVPTAEIAIISPEGPREGPDGEVLGITTACIRREDLPALIAALQEIADMPDQEWQRL